jgi:hypothetical protein
MSDRAHFWLRIIGIAIILAAEFGPKLASPRSAPAANAPIARAGVAIAR